MTTEILVLQLGWEGQAIDGGVVAVATTVELAQQFAEAIEAEKGKSIEWRLNPAVDRFPVGVPEGDSWWYFIESVPLLDSPRAEVSS